MQVLLWKYVVELNRLIGSQPASLQYELSYLKPFVKKKWNNGTCLFWNKYLSGLKILQKIKQYQKQKQTKNKKKTKKNKNKKQKTKNKKQKSGNNDTILYNLKKKNDQYFMSMKR